MSTSQHQPDVNPRLANPRATDWPSNRTSCCAPGGCCGESTTDRRAFLKLSAAVAAGALAGPVRPIFAGPFQSQPGVELIPRDKKLNPAWVRSLFERAGPLDLRGDELRYIGMPVGGLCAGTMYLSGDGRLWVWDVFNRVGGGVLPNDIPDLDGQNISATSGANYVRPAQPGNAVSSPVEQGFTLRLEGGGTEQTRTLDSGGFGQVSFRGEYPIGTVGYRDAGCPVEVTLEAFSPFIPLNTADSSLPATLLHFTLHNTGAKPLRATLAGRLGNAVCKDSSGLHRVRRRNRILRQDDLLLLECAAESDEGEVSARPDISFDDFERGDWGAWEAQGDAFAGGPFARAAMPAYHDVRGHLGERVVNSHNTRVTEKTPAAGDKPTGTLLSPVFRIERRFINFLIGGGGHAGSTEVQLLVDDRVVRSMVGPNSNTMRAAYFDVSGLEGRFARMRLIDYATGAWGHIAIDDIVFSDQPRSASTLDEEPDFGTLVLALLEPAPEDRGIAAIDDAGLFGDAREDASRSSGGGPIGALARTVELGPGESCVVRFAVVWHFPNLVLPSLGRVGRWYASRFRSAREVAKYVAANEAQLSAETRRWRDTWYDSTLPRWLLERTFANASTLATQTCLRFTDGRFWAWEGVGCCAGTCTHVWHYAQAVAHLFPDLERDLRERTDFGLAMDPKTGKVDFRAGLAGRDAVDGQAGLILRAQREHQMSRDDGFLKHNWPRIRKALEFMMQQDAADGTADGMIEGEQHNTLDAEWYGQIPALTSMYLAALRSGSALATLAGDAEFARQCDALLASGRTRFEALFNGEYFEQKLDPKHAEAIGVAGGCHIDQVLGQWWTLQLGNGRLFDAEKARSALRSLWTYNFGPDVGPLRASLPPANRGRPYALSGDAGLLMCTWPREAPPEIWKKHWQFMYFNECMSGFEHQAAAHMLWEGLDDPELLQCGLATERAIHDRYHPALRNPYNEVECSDHYARAMASYGVFLAACGFRYDGPAGEIEFAPRLEPQDFRCPFTAAEGWGTFSQKCDGDELAAELAVRFGQVELSRIALRWPAELRGRPIASVRIDGTETQAFQTSDDGFVRISLEPRRTLDTGHSVRIRMTT